MNRPYPRPGDLHRVTTPIAEYRALEEPATAQFGRRYAQTEVILGATDHGTIDEAEGFRHRHVRDVDNLSRFGFQLGLLGSVQLTTALTDRFEINLLENGLLSCLHQHGIGERGQTSSFRYR